jgi:hypothetical protein
VGIENVEALTEEPVEGEDAPRVRESDLAVRERQDREKAEANRARQIRLGHVPDPNAEEEGEEKPKKAAPRKKSAAKSE